MTDDIKNARRALNFNQAMANQYFRSAAEMFRRTVELEDVDAMRVALSVLNSHIRMGEAHLKEVEAIAEHWPHARDDVRFEMDAYRDGWNAAVEEFGLEAKLTA